MKPLSWCFSSSYSLAIDRRVAPYPITLPSTAKGLPSTLVCGNRVCRLGDSVFDGTGLCDFPASHCVNAVVELCSPFSGTPRSARHSERKPCTSNPRNHSCRRAVGMHSSRFRMIASSAMRGSRCTTTRCPDFVFTEQDYGDGGRSYQQKPNPYPSSFFVSDWVDWELDMGVKPI